MKIKIPNIKDYRCKSFRKKRGKKWCRYSDFCSWDGKMEEMVFVADPLVIVTNIEAINSFIHVFDSVLLTQ